MEEQVCKLKPCSLNIQYIDVRAKLQSQLTSLFSKVSFTGLLKIRSKLERGLFCKCLDNVGGETSLIPHLPSLCSRFLWPPRAFDNNNPHIGLIACCKSLRSSKHFYVCLRGQEASFDFTEKDKKKKKQRELSVVIMCGY